MKDKELVMVGMSGGVDSAVSAALLLENDYRVEGLHMTNWNDEEPYCTASQDLQDARNACKELNITMHHVNFSKEYKEKVFQDALKELNEGLTPNPDVLCNKEIKFEDFAKYAWRLGADKIATGHYARTIEKKGLTYLLKGIDNNKDQSYFLHAINPDILQSVIFPLGELNKKQVRNYAFKKGLPNHNKPDSTGICFIGERPFKDFIKTFLPPKPGCIVNENGKEMGTHEGLMYFTIGQRKDLGIGGIKNLSGEPWYVAEKRQDSNELMVVQGRNHPKLWTNTLFANSMHWLNPEMKKHLQKETTLECQAKTRYRQKDAHCIIKKYQDGLEIRFKDSQWAITYGQYLVLYQKDYCLGGAKIMPFPK